MCKVYLNRQYLLNTVMYVLLFIPGYFGIESFLSKVLGQRDQISSLAKHAFGILGFGNYFSVQAETTILYSIAMNEPSISLIPDGLATLIFLGVVLLFTLVLEYGFMGLLWATALFFFLRFAISFPLIHYKQGFKEANSS